MHIMLLTLFVVWAGTSAFGAIHLPDPQVLLYGGAAAVVALAAIAFAIPAIRHILRDRLVPILGRSIHGLLHGGAQPLNILMLLGGSVVVTTGYLVAMYSATLAFGGDLSFAKVGVIYLTGSALRERRAHAGRHRRAGSGGDRRTRRRGHAQRHRGAVGVPLPPRHLLVPDPPRLGRLPMDAEGRLLVVSPD